MSPSPVSTDPVTRARYSQGAGIYRIVPAAVARPATIAELRTALAVARESGLCVTPRGAGSAMDGGNVTSGMLLDLSDLDPARCVIDPVHHLAALSPAISLATLNSRATIHGLRLAVDPSSGKWATLGGMVATNAAGPHSLRAGSVRRWIRSVELETADGPLALSRGRDPDASHPVIRRWRAEVEPVLRRREAVIRARFPAVSKNSAGYALDRYLDHGDILDVVIGSEGTLGVLTNVVAELERMPAHRASLRVALRDRADLVATIGAIGASDAATLELLDRSFLRVIAGRTLTPDSPGLLGAAAGILLADFEGDDREEVLQRAASASRAVEATSLDVRLATDPDEIDRLWAIRHDASPILAGLADGRRSLQVIEDGCVPVARLAEYLDCVDAASRAARIDAVMFGHAGDGHVHVNLLPNLRDADWKDRVRAIFRAVSDAVIALGGTPSGEHGAGRLRSALMEELYGREVVDCFRAVKHAFDPGGLFNPGVILDDGRDPLSRLKVGGDADVLPPGVEAYLQQIEAGARWAESRWPSEADQ